jgi:hypothetical protein
MAAGFGILILFGACAIALAMFGLFIWMVFLIYRAAASVPVEHRRMDPGLVWLLVIPVFQNVWAFFVAGQVCGGLSDAFEARGLERGDCGRFKGLAYAVLTVIQLGFVIVGAGVQFAGTIGMSEASGGEQASLSPLQMAGMGATGLASILGIGGLVFLVLFVVEVNRRGKELSSLEPKSIDVGAHPRTE